MTYAQDQEDLARHEREIREHRSFNYAVLDPGESALFGCVYIDPAEKAGADADVSWWVITHPEQASIEATLLEARAALGHRSVAVHAPAVHRP